MTEESYQQCRKVMATANHIRGMITGAKGDVAKWSNIEDSFRKSLQQGKADGANKMLQRAMEKLEKWRKKFADLKFPESDIIAVKKETVQCEGCGANIAKGNTYCGECLCED